MDAIKDQNHIPVMLGVSYIDGTTLVPIGIDSTTGGLCMDLVHTTTYASNTLSVRDENHKNILMGVNSVTGLSCPVFVDPVTGGILADN